MKTGVELITEERSRQISKEGWSETHDDEHDQGELAMAAVCYAATEPIYVKNEEYNQGPSKDPNILFSCPWPWESEWWKPTPKDRVRQLVKAGALIAAEIDRLQRKRKKGKAK